MGLYVGRAGSGNEAHFCSGRKAHYKLNKNTTEGRKKKYERDVRDLRMKTWYHGCHYKLLHGCDMLQAKYLIDLIEDQVCLS